MKIYQTLAACALAVEVGPRARRADTNNGTSIDYDESRRVDDDNDARAVRAFGASGNTRSYSMRKDMISAQLASRQIPYFYYHFHDYGCYCIAQNHETNPLKNRGKPLDHVDAVCQAHSRCQQCVFADSDGAINPKSTGYQMTINRKNGDITCDGKDSYPKKYQQNGSWEARYNACQCDRELAIGLADAAQAGLHNKAYEDHDGSLCAAHKAPKPARVSSMEASRTESAPASVASVSSPVGSGPASPPSSAGFGGFGGSSGGVQATGSQVDFVSSQTSPLSPISPAASSQVEAGSLQMNQVMNAAFEPLPEVELVGAHSSFQTFGSGVDVFVSENVGQCCGTYPKRVPIPHSGTHQCCNGILRATGSC